MDSDRVKRWLPLSKSMSEGRVEMRLCFAERKRQPLFLFCLVSNSPLSEMREIERATESQRGPSRA